MTHDRVHLRCFSLPPRGGVAGVEGRGVQQAGFAPEGSAVEPRRFGAQFCAKMTRSSFACFAWRERSPSQGRRPAYSPPLLGGDLHPICRFGWLLPASPQNHSERQWRTECVHFRRKCCQPGSCFLVFLLLSFPENGISGNQHLRVRSSLSSVSQKMSLALLKVGPQEVGWKSAPRAVLATKACPRPRTAEGQEPPRRTQHNLRASPLPSPNASRLPQSLD